MEDAGGWKLWTKSIFENGKILGNKIITGIKDTSIYAAGKTKEGAIYMAEKAKPATERIKQGVGYISSQVKNTFENVKNKISKDKGDNNNINNNNINKDANNEINNDNDNNNIDAGNKFDLLGTEYSSNYSQINS